MTAPARIDIERTERRASWRQVLFVFGSLEAALWTAGAVQGFFIALTVALTVAWAFSERWPWPDLGIDPASIRRGWWIAPVGATIAGLILLGAWRWHTLRLPAGSLVICANLLFSLIWAFAQQFLAQSFFFLHLEYLLRSGRKAVIATALLFSSAHIPNPVLVPVTLVGGLVLSEWFRRNRTLYMLAVAHALVALSLAVSVPETVLHDMRVGIGYIRYSERHVQPSDRHSSLETPNSGASTVAYARHRIAVALIPSFQARFAEHPHGTVERRAEWADRPGDGRIAWYREGHRRGIG